MKHYFEEYTTALHETVRKINMNSLEEIYESIRFCQRNDKNIYIIGNGGSSASASHWVCDFNKGINVRNSKRTKMFSLSDNTPIVTALGNDISYDEIFREQLKNYMQRDDLVIALSVSGNSPNLIEAFKYAQKEGGKTLSIIGNFNGEILQFSDLHLIVDSQNYGIVEDIHMIICHAISQFMKTLNSH